MDKRLRQSGLKFVDVARVKVTPGPGGDGCVSFRREKYIPYGGPDGGDGGNGGDIIVKSGLNFSSLKHLKTNFTAQAGEKGHGKMKTGKNAKHMIIHVPVGTVVKIRPLEKEGEENQKKKKKQTVSRLWLREDSKKWEVLADFTKDNLEVTIANGGKGGKGLEIAIISHHHGHNQSFFFF